MYIYIFFNNLILFYCKEYVNIGQNGVSLLESTDGSIQKRHGNRVRIFTNKDFVSKETLISSSICFYTFSHIKQELFTSYRQVKSYKDGLHKERVHILLIFIKFVRSISFETFLFHT